MNKKLYLWIWLVIPIVLSIITIIFIYNYAFPDVDLPSGTYRFDVLSSSKEGYIRDYGIEYDFKNNEGNISFRFFGYVENLTRLYIHLPEQLKIINFSIKVKDENIHSCYLVSNNSSITCENIFEGDSAIYVFLNLTSTDFYPNGLFVFNFNSDDTTLKYYEDTYSYDMIRFNLGDYRCSEKCFSYESSNSNISYNSNKEIFRVYISPVGIDKFGRGGRFFISTYNFYKEKISAVYLALSISVLSGSIFLLFNIIREYFKGKADKPK